MKRTLYLVLVIATLGLSTAAQDPPASTQPKLPAKQKVIVTAAQANGTYRSDQNEFRILALGRNRLKVQFDGVRPTAAGSVNLGYAAGEVVIDGNIATFKPPDTEHCEITLIFLPNKLKVMQDGSDADCGFGHNVFANGTYRKVKSGKPKFEPPQ